MPNVIDSFRGKYEFLSNFYPNTIIVEGIAYPTAEHAFQAMKTLDIHTRYEISGLPTPDEAKKAGRKVRPRQCWNDIKVAIMYHILTKKFDNGSYLSAKLLRTEDAHLAEGNNWGDMFWGVVENGRGQNILGTLLMARRDALRVIMENSGDSSM